MDFELFVLQARGGIEQDVLEAYCWMYSTWNIPKEYKGACSGGDQVREKSFERVNISYLSHATVLWQSWTNWNGEEMQRKLEAQP